MADDPFAGIAQSLPKTKQSSDPFASIAKPLNAAPPATPEGTYSLRSPSGKTEAIPYSAVPDARKKGYQFADHTILNRYAKDFSADPKHSGVINQWLQNASWYNPAAAATRVAEGFGQGMEEIPAGIDVIARKVTHTKPTKAEENLQLNAAEQPVTGVEQGIGQLGEQVGELVLTDGMLSGLTEGAHVPEAISASEKVKQVASFLDKYPKIKAAVGLGLKVASEGGKAAAEQGTQTLVHTGGDTAQMKQAAEVGGIAGAATPLAAEALGQFGDFTKNVLRHRFGADERTTEEWIEDTKKANGDIDKQYRSDVKAARQATRSTEGTEPYVEGKEVKKPARLEYDEAVAKQHATEAKRQNLTDAIAKARSTIRQRLQNIHDASRVYFSKAYGDLQEKAGSQGVDYGTLAEGVHDALQEVKGSAESTKAFKDILARSGRLEEAPTASREVLERLAELDPDERAIELKRLREGGEPVDASLADLNGYYSELGRVVDSGSTPGDVKAAAQKLRGFIDQQIKDTLGDELYQENKAVRAQYRRFAQGFLDYSGPAGSGSPVAMALQAKDAFNATRPFVGNAAEEDQRIADILAGSSRESENAFTGQKIASGYTRNAEGKLEAQGTTAPAWRYRKQTLGMVHDLQNMESGLKEMPTSEKLAADTKTASEKLAMHRAEIRQEPQPSLKLEKMSPEKLQKVKAEIYGKTIHNLGKFGTWVAIGGIVGGLNAFITKASPERAGEEIAGGVVMGMVAPYAISKMLGSPGVVESLSRPTRKDLTMLAALPPTQREGVEEGIRVLAAEAIRQGKLKASQIPWLRIIGGEAAKNTAQTVAPRGERQQVQSQDQLGGQNYDQMQQELDQMQQGATQ